MLCAPLYKCVARLQLHLKFASGVVQLFETRPERGQTSSFSSIRKIWPLTTTWKHQYIEDGIFNLLLKACYDLEAGNIFQCFIILPYWLTHPIVYGLMPLEERMPCLLLLLHPLAGSAPHLDVSSCHGHLLGNIWCHWCQSSVVLHSEADKALQKVQCNIICFIRDVAKCIPNQSRKVVW